MASRDSTTSAPQRQWAFMDLCREYDRLLGPDAEPVTSAVRADLATFARILDLDPGLEAAPAAEIWRQVRGKLAAEVAPATDFASTAPMGFQPKVFLPAARGTAEPTDAFSQASNPLSLMVVEDDGDLAAAIMETLAEAGHRVVAHASTAQSAIGQAALHPLDLAIVDVGLAEGTCGVDVATALRDRWGVPVLFLSGGRNEHLVTFETAVGFLGKPFNGAELLAALTLAAPLLDRR